LTVQRIGWADEISASELTAVGEAAAGRCSRLSPLKLTVGPLAGSPGAVRFSVLPWEPVFKLRRELLDANNSVLATCEKPREFRPHIGIAYCNKPVPTAPLHATVEPLRALPAVDVNVHQVDLVLLSRDGRTYAYSKVRSLPLSGRSNAD
jgi:2'-5' RNA ligase